jgi:hypothetical protein
MLTQFNKIYSAALEGALICGCAIRTHDCDKATREELTTVRIGVRPDLL